MSSASINTPKLPLTARALIFDPSTHAFDFRESHPLPDPDYSKGDHLIHVHATALCARELEWPREFPEAIFSENPEKTVVPGYDLAGTVVTSPPDSPFTVGDEIYARTRPSRPGNCRGYTIARTVEMALKPKSLDWVHAAAVPLSAITAWQALFVHGGVDVAGLKDLSRNSGRKVLVTAAAGGVGVWIVQLAKLAGCHVVAQIGSPGHDKLVTELGASETINYRETSLKTFAEKGGSADLVIDLVGRKTLEEAWYTVRDGGALISIVEPPEGRKPEDMAHKDVHALFFIMEPDGSQLAQVSRLLDEGKCRPVLDSVWSLEEYQKAFDRVDGGHATGKVVVMVME